MFNKYVKKAEVRGHLATLGFKVKDVKLMVRKADGRLLTPEENQKEIARKASQ